MVMARVRVGMRVRVRPRARELGLTMIVDCALEEYLG